MEKYLKDFKNCLQKEVPYCQGACPFHLDILDFIEKMKRGGFNAAFKAYRNAVGFPRIISQLCNAPCGMVCPLKDYGGAIELLALEQACILHSGNTAPTDYNLPLKKKRIAVVGAGLPGLSCALRLAMKKYEVVIFEKEDKIGGRLWSLLPSSLFLADIEEQFQYEAYELRVNAEIRDLDSLCQEFDAVFLSAGSFPHTEAPIFTIQSTGFFVGGCLLRQDYIDAAANGLSMATAIDNYLKTGNLIYPEDSRGTAMCLHPGRLPAAEKTIPAAKDADGSYTKESASAEASRCLECQCDACKTYCDMASFYNKWPLRIRDEIQATVLPGSAEVKATPAKRLLNTCTQCGLCMEICPADIDLGGLVLEGRKSMHRQEKMPWAFHEFWLRDMEFSNGPLCAIAKMAPEHDAIPETSASEHYAFFPGCQLGASEPALVKAAYAWLRQRYPDAGLLLQCCGAPEEWSGRETEHAASLQELENRWKSMGKPTLIVACPTCLNKFRQHLPEIPVAFLYDVMCKEPLAANKQDRSSGSMAPCDSAGWAIFDPCSTRQLPDQQNSIRQLCHSQGIRFEELSGQKEHTACCSFGGQSHLADPQFTDFVANRRLTESPLPYITYCINCRDAFLAMGRQSVHILEFLLLPKLQQPLPTSPAKQPPTPTQRRQNRINLKTELLNEIWNTEQEPQKPMQGITLIIAEELKKKLAEDRLLEEDLMAAIDFCQRHNRRVQNPTSGTYSGYREIGFTTYWVEYRETEQWGTFELVNAYCHRMKIELEAVWNGRKTDLDLQ